MWRLSLPPVGTLRRSLLPREWREDGASEAESRGGAAGKILLGRVSCGAAKVYERLMLLLWVALDEGWGC